MFMPPMPPDPEKVMESFNRIKDAFQAAADQTTGPAQPLFQKLSDVFNRAVTNGMDMLDKEPNLNAVMFTLAPVLKELKETVIKIEAVAQQDPAVARTVEGLKETLREELQNIMGGAMPGLPKKAAPKLPPKQPPKRPPNGDFSF